MSTDTAEEVTAIVPTQQEARDRARTIAQRRGHELSAVWHEHSNHLRIRESNMCLNCFAYVTIRHDNKVMGPVTNKDCKG